LRNWLSFLVLIAASLPAAGHPPEGFVLETYVSGLDRPVDLQWAPNGLLYVADKGGTVAVIQDGTLLPAPFMDIRNQVNRSSDRGLLGLALHPAFPATPWVYIVYVYDPPETLQRTGTAGPDGTGQRVSRLVRVTADAATGYTKAVPGSERVILGAASTWANIGDPAAQQTDTAAARSCGSTGGYVDDCIPADGLSHAIGSIAFGPDGMLYVGNGDAATWTTVDPGALRSLDPDSLAGKILRIDPDTGRGLPGNPFWNGDPTSNRSRVWQLGLRNPFRFRIHPDDGVLWIGDVGWEDWEELNRAGPGADFGWPCYEGGPTGSLQLPGYSALAACKAYLAGANATAPVYAYPHRSGFGGSIIAGEFYRAAQWPAEYQGAIFLSDYSFQEISYARTSGGSVQVLPFADDVLSVDLAVGPDGHLYSANIVAGAIERIRYVGGGGGGGQTGSTVARFAQDFAAPVPAPGWSFRWNESGPVGSAGGESQLLWDSNGRYDSDGAPGLPDASGFAWGYVGSGSVHPGRGTNKGEANDRFALLRYTVATDGYFALRDSLATHVGCQFSNGVEIRVLAGVALARAEIVGRSESRSFDADLGYLAAGTPITVAVGPNGNDGCDATRIDWRIDYTPGAPASGSAPRVTIDLPAAGNLWRVGDQVQLLGSASDAEDGAIPASSMVWDGSIIHNTHEHPDFYFADSNSGVFIYPDHGDNSYVRVCLTATDSDGQSGSDCADVPPETSTYSFDTVPTGLVLNYNGESFVTPFSLELPVGGERQLSAPLAQSGYVFTGWSGGGDATQTLVVGSSAQTLVASYADANGGGGGGTGGSTVAGFAADFAQPAPAPGWSYRWNERGALGDLGAESDLLWDGAVRYDSDGAPGLPDASGLAWGYVTGGKVHPGRGVSNGEAADRFVIMRYVVEAAGDYALSNAVARHVGCQFSNGVDIRILAGGSLLRSEILGAGQTVNLDLDLGYLAAGQPITIALGPNGRDGCDATEIDWQLDFVPAEPPPATP
jgi:glucose/arabinose dehydrogenase